MSLIEVTRPTSTVTKCLCAANMHVMLLNFPILNRALYLICLSEGAQNQWSVEIKGTEKRSASEVIRNCANQSSFLFFTLRFTFLLLHFFCYKLSLSASSANILDSFCMSKWCKLPQSLAPISWTSYTQHVSYNTICVSANAVVLQPTATKVRKSSRRK